MALTCLLLSLGRGKESVQREARLPRERKLVQTHHDQDLDALRVRLAALELLEAQADEERQVDQELVRGALHLKLAEQDVGAEEREGLVEDVLLSWKSETVRISGRGDSTWVFGKKACQPFT